MSSNGDKLKGRVYARYVLSERMTQFWDPYCQGTSHWTRFVHDRHTVTRHSSNLTEFKLLLINSFVSLCKIASLQKIKDFFDISCFVCNLLMKLEGKIKLTSWLYFIPTWRETHSRYIMVSQQRQNLNCQSSCDNRKLSSLFIELCFSLTNRMKNSRMTSFACNL